MSSNRDGLGLMMAVSTWNNLTMEPPMKTYIIIYHTGKVEVLTNQNPQAALDYLADNHEYIDTIYQGDLVSFPQAKEQEEGE